MTDSPEEEAALDADAKAYRADEQREAVARAICRADGCEGTCDCTFWTEYRKQADAAIAALAAAQQEPAREPWQCPYCKETFIVPPAAQQEPAAFEWKPAAPKLLRPTAAQQEPET